MLRWLSKYFALRGYRVKLGPALAKRYGRQRYYTANQVRVTVEKLALPVEYLCYGLAGFCEERAFNEYHSSVGEVCDWREMRQEAADQHIGNHSGHGGHAHYDQELGDHDAGHHPSDHHHGTSHGHDSGGHHH